MMFRTRERIPVSGGAIVLGRLLFSLGFLSLVPAAQGEAPEKVRIGIVRSFFRDVPESQVGALMPPFQALMQAQTGLPSELASPAEPDGLVEELLKDHVHLGIFQGVEFAWERQKHPELRPLVITVNQHRNRQARLLIRQEFQPATFAGLKGKALAIPRRSREHVHLFVQRQCREHGHAPGQFFSRIVTPATIEDALDDVVDGEVEAAVVDGVGLDCYLRRKPGRFAKLKELLKSDWFPDSVVAYRRGALDEATVRRFQAGLLQAHKTATGRLLLLLWTLTAFEPIPADYEQMLTEIAKAYPPTLRESTSKEDKKKSSK